MKIHQTLHGYNDGHTLLSSSIELPPDLKRVMLPMTDISGVGIVKGFEEYITGYPLKKGNFYALAKTWYAPEMKRPGCVWTHTLLIDFTDLANINDVSFLLGLFHRPDTINPELNIYKNSINFEFAPPILDEPINENRDLVFSIIDGLYSYEEPVVMQAQSSIIYEHLFLKLWIQQWPRLKRNFSFSTGSISLRKFENQLLDLQITPILNDKTQIDDITIVNESLKNSPEEWVHLIYNDLIDSNLKLRVFLNFFGSDIDLKRNSFKLLSKSYVYFADKRPSLYNSIAFLATTFKRQNEASSLKSVILFGFEHPISRWMPTYKEDEIIIELSTTSFFEHFDYRQLNYFERFSQLFKDVKDNKIAILTSIINAGPNKYGEQAITNLANEIDDQHLDLIGSDRQLSSVFFILNHRLCYNKTFWIKNTGNHYEILNTLRNSEVNNVDWGRIAKILIELNSKVSAAILEDENYNLTWTILDWLNDSEEDNLGRNWKSHLKRNVPDILKWLNHQNHFQLHLVLDLVKILDPNSSEVIKNGFRPWINILVYEALEKRKTLPLDLLIFCLALSLNSKSQDALELKALTFEEVYIEIQRPSGLNYQRWKLLEVHTKSLSVWKNWNKGLKLFNAVVDSVPSNKKSEKILLAGINNTELYNQLSKAFKKRS